MPALVSSSSQSNENKSHGIRNPPSRTKRLVRRRGRGKDELSDEEVEREALSDSDFSSVSTDSAAHSEDDEDTAHRTFDAVPQKSRSIRSSAPSPPAIFPQPNGHKPFFDSPTNWSEMVTAEQAAGDGSSNLPILNFEDLTSHADNASSTLHAPEEVVEPKTRASKRKGKKLSRVDEKDGGGNATSVSAPRPPKPNPRQVYLDRLSSDPSYVPRVGAFWSHDERLMDKDLRSMSGWWRGRWQGKGRGTSRPDGPIPGRGRGRSNFGPPTGGSVLRPMTKDAKRNSANTSSPAAPATKGDRSWSHDGYEELDESDLVRLQDRVNLRGNRNGGPRGGLHGGDPFSRGAARPPVALSTTSDIPTPAQSSIGPKPQPPRLVKAERPWTKPLDTSLLGHHPKAKMSTPGLTELRVQLPVRAPLSRTRATLLDHALGLALAPRTDRSEASGDGGDKAVVVRLPGPLQSSSSPRSRHPVTQSVSFDLQTVSDDDLDSPSAAKVWLPSKSSATIVPPPEANIPPPLVTLAGEESQENTGPEPPHFDGIQDSKPFSTPETESVPSQGPNEEILDVVEEKDPFVVQVPPNLERPKELLRQAFAPQSQQSAYHPGQAPLAYNNVSEYSPYPAPLPLPAGLAVGENGMFFEVATGRIVVLTPPPAPLFTPRPPPYFPAMSHPYPIRHSHSHSLTPDFLTPPSATPPGTHVGQYPYSGRDSPRYAAYEGKDEAPIFVPARQTSGALEIRAPAPASAESSLNGSPATSNGERRPHTPASGSGTASGAKGANKTPFRPSGLRSSINADVPLESLTNGAPPAPYVMSRPQYVQPYPGSPFYPVSDYAGYAHSYGADPQYGYYGQGLEAPYGYPVPPQHDGSVDYTYASYQGAPYAQDPRAQGMYY